MNPQRAEYIKALFQEEGYHALVCRTPQHVVMLTGYQPILGNSFCIVSLNSADEIEVRLVVPADEQDLVPPGIALEVKTFAVETMDSISTTLDAIRTPLSELLRSAGIGEGHIVGYEGAVEPIIPAYTQLGVPSPEMHKLLHLLLLGAELRTATSLLNELAAIKTEEDLVAIRKAEALAYQGFEAARDAIKVGTTEAEVAAVASATLLRAGYTVPGAQHVQPHVHVMAGARAALAYRAFNLTSNAPIEQGDPVMVQMEVGINGYWAELTRTFFAQTVSSEWRKVHQACVEAQDAALKTIHDGVLARDVDAAARQVMQQASFGAAFKHGLGHGLGFQAINHAAVPILHPASHAVLRRGMVHNMEPAVYLDGKGGFRLNDNVVVQVEDGEEASYSVSDDIPTFRSLRCEVLSSALPRTLDWLIVQQ